MKMGEYKIIATFKYGRVWSNWLFGFMIALFVGISIGFACFSVAMWNENLPLSIWGFLIDIFFIGLFVFEIVKAIRNRRYVIECLKDAIEKKVVAKLFDKDNMIGRNYRGVKVAVSFHYKQKKIKLNSIYDRMFESYIDREVTILYSPNNEGVLLCKAMEKSR